MEWSLQQPSLRLNLFSISSPIPNSLPCIFLWDRQTFLTWSSVSQWLLCWAFSLFVPYFSFLWKSGKCWTVANWYSRVFGQEDYGRESEQPVCLWLSFHSNKDWKMRRRYLLTVPEIWRWGIPCPPCLSWPVEAQHRDQQHSHWCWAMVSGSVWDHSLRLQLLDNIF